MKFKAKETIKVQGTELIWIIKDKIYDLEESGFIDEYVFKGEVGNCQAVSKVNLYKMFESVEEVKKPRACEIFGLEVGEIFEIEFSKGDSTKGYFFDEKGYLYNRGEQEFNGYIADLLNGDYKIIKLPQYTDEEKEIFKALKVLGFGWIAKDDGGAIWLYSNKPIKAKFTWNGKNPTRIKIDEAYNILKSFVEWEDVEPFEIPNIE